jgi:hypothetical protein
MTIIRPDGHTRSNRGPKGKSWRWGEGKRTTGRDATERRHAANIAAGFCRCGGTPRPNRVTCQNCADRGRELSQRYRAEVLAHYGGKCVCCGEAEPGFLTMDHTNNDGEVRRQHTEWQHSNIYYWARKHGFPPDLRILCYNCNYARAHRGVCPHETARQAMMG